MLKFPPTDLRFPPTDRDCPCVDCLDGVPPRNPRDSLGNPNPTAGDLHEMNLHAEYLENDYVWLLCGRHWIHLGCAKNNFFVFAAKNPYVAMYRLPCWLCGQMDEHRRQLVEFFATWDVEAAASEAVAGNSLPGTPTEDERADYSRGEDSSEETSNDDCNEWYEAFEGHAPANSPMVRMPPVANAKGKGKANGKDNAKAKGKANGDPRNRPAGIKPKRNAKKPTVILDCDWEGNLSLQEAKRRRQ